MTPDLHGGQQCFVPKYSRSSAKLGRGKACSYFSTSWKEKTLAGSENIWMGRTWNLLHFILCKGGNPAIVKAGSLGHAQRYFSGNARGRNLISLALWIKKVHINKHFFFFPDKEGLDLWETLCGKIAIQSPSTFWIAMSKYVLCFSVELLSNIPTRKPKSASGPPALLGHTSALAGPCLSQEH